MKRCALTTGIVGYLIWFASAGLAADKPAFPLAWEVTEGIQSPESAYFDAGSGFVFVSNIGDGGPTDKDGDGYLSKLTPDGRVVTAKWITGLNAPKGIRSFGGRLWVSDIDRLVGVDIAQGKIVERVSVPDAEFLNDVACDAQGAVYVSDMTTNAIHRYRDGALSVFASGDKLEHPNGLLVVGNQLVVGGWGSGGEKPVLGRLFSLDLATGQKTLLTPEPVGNLDGIETVAEGRYLVSDWAAGKIFYIRQGGTVDLVMQLPKGAADIGYVPDGRLLLVPQMLENKVSAFRLQRPDEPKETNAAASGTPAWPKFHGPQGDNLSPAEGLLQQWPEDGPQMVWTASGIGAGFSSVTLGGGLLYTAGNVGDATVVTALDLDGKTRWQTPCGKAWTAGPGGTRATPTIDGSRLYYETPYGDVVCLDAQSGERIWGLNILDQFGSSNITWGLSESILVDGDRAICLPGGPNVSVVALDKNTGEVVWKAPSAEGDLAGYATARLVEYEGLRIILTKTSRAAIGVNADTGDLLFRYPHRTEYDVNATTPLFHDGWVFLTSGYGTTGSVMLQLKVEGPQVGVEKVWESRELDNHHGGAILLDGAIYSAAHNFNSGRWICLDWKTGQLRYAERGVGKGSLTYADGMLYTYSENRAVGLVPAVAAEHQVVSRFRTPSGPDGPTWAHPVVCGGRLYLRHDDKLYAYDVQKQGN
jgi:outer membrane protein assembly factor BamB